MLGARKSGNNNQIIKMLKWYIRRRRISKEEPLTKKNNTHDAARANRTAGQGSRCRLLPEYLRCVVVPIKTAASVRVKKKKTKRRLCRGRGREVTNVCRALTDGGWMSAQKLFLPKYCKNDSIPLSKRQGYLDVIGAYFRFIHTLVSNNHLPSFHEFQAQSVD